MKGVQPSLIVARQLEDIQKVHFWCLQWTPLQLLWWGFSVVILPKVEDPPHISLDVLMWPQWCGPTSPIVGGWYDVL